MLYVISGVPRSGKSQLAKLLNRKYSIPYISTDILRDALGKAYPQLGIQENMRDRDRTPILWPFFKGIVEEYKWYKSDYVMEGTNFNPEDLATIKDYEYVKICFLGYKDTTPEKKLFDIRENPSEAEWTYDIEETQLKEWIASWIRRSNSIYEICKSSGINYYDTSNNFEAVIEKVAVELTTKHSQA